MTPRRLVLIRHASAAPAGPDGDEARNLTDAGYREAEELGAWLKSSDLLGDAVVCSPAARTRQTWAAIDEATAHGVLIEMEPAVYEADVDALMQVVRERDPETRTLILVGHAPGIPALAAELCAGRGDEAALAELNRGFAPASCAVVTFDGDWADATSGIGELLTVRPGTK